MGTMKEYIETYGDRTFDEMPFGEVDNAVFCKLSYVPMERVVPRDVTREPVRFADAAKALLAYDGGQYLPQGLFIGSDVSYLAQKLAHTRRYGDLRLVGCIGIDEAEPAVQFGAQTFILPDGTLVIPFRGTNDSLFGWKEDLDILAKRNIPSYQLALDYVKTVADLYPGKLILCGHSKGGNVALYTAMHLDQALRARLIALYNNDGPGFWDYRYVYTPAYTKLLPVYHHFVPDTSMIGLMLAHDEDYEVVRSYNKHGIAQHDLSSWKVEGAALVRAKDLTRMGKFTDILFQNTLMKINEEQAHYVEQFVTRLIRASGQRSLIGLSRNAGQLARGAADVWNETEKPARRMILSVFRGAGRAALHAAKTVRFHATERFAARMPARLG